MKTQPFTEIFPKNLSIDDVLNILEDKVQEWNCSLEEALDRLVSDKLKENN